MDATLQEAKPYKGWDSYQAEDAELFFGRERDAEQVIARILSSPFTLLHATSGAGKTSLLNARIIPGLEERGWTPVRIELLDDPVDAVRIATLHTLMPPPQAEAAALRRVLDKLASPEEDPALQELRSRHKDLPVTDPDKRLLLKPLQGYSTPESVALPRFGRVTPYICRWLRGSLGETALSEHFAAIAAFSPAPETIPRIDGTSRASELLALLSDPDFVQAYESLLEMLYLPLPDLPPFFENLVELYGERRSNFSLVLLFDQFEELFTRFVDPGPVSRDGASSSGPGPSPGENPHASLPDWRLRWELIRQIELLHKAAEADLPLRFVLSMREEFVAKLDPFRRFVPDLDRSAFHMSLLEVVDAQEAIQRPARKYRYRYSPDCYTRIIEQLSLEGRYVEPIHIQIVCDKLWTVRGHQIAAEPAAADEEVEESSLPAIELAVFEKLGESEGILRSFFHELIEELSPDDRLETLEMLQPLLTPSGTRNIVAWDQLVAMPFRSRERREKLLETLRRKNIVRTERRLGGQFVEITHEFLIPPVQEAIRERLTGNPAYGRFLDALRGLEMAQHRILREGTLSPLQRDALEVLEQAIERIDPGFLGSELLLRSALLAGCDRTSLAVWAGRVARGQAVCSAAELVLAWPDSGGNRKLFSRDEIEAIDSMRSTLGRHDLPLERILRSILAQAGDEGGSLGREQVRYWTRRLLGYEL